MPVLIWFPKCKKIRNEQIGVLGTHETLSKYMYMSQARDAKQSWSLSLVQIRIAQNSWQTHVCTAIH